MQNERTTQEMNLVNVEEKIREKLQSVQNMNAFYRYIGLNTNYLNIKNFRNGKDEHLKKKSWDTIQRVTGYQLYTLMINPDELTEEEIQVLSKIQDRFLNKFQEVIDNMPQTRSRITSRTITDEDRNSVAESIFSAFDGSLDDEISMDIMDNMDNDNNDNSGNNGNNDDNVEIEPVESTEVAEHNDLEIDISDTIDFGNIDIQDI